MVGKVKNCVHKPTKSSQLRALDELFFTPKPIPRRNDFGHSVHISGGTSRARHMSEASSTASIVTAGPGTPRASTSKSVSEASPSKTTTLPELSTNSSIYVTPWEFQEGPLNYITPAESEGCSSIHTTSPKFGAAPSIVITPPEKMPTDTMSNRPTTTHLSAGLGSFSTPLSTANRGAKVTRQVEAANIRATQVQTAEAQAIEKPKVTRGRSAANCGVKISRQVEAVDVQAVEDQVTAHQTAEEAQAGESQAIEKPADSGGETSEAEKRAWLERTDVVVRGYIRENDQFVNKLVQLRDKSVGNEEYLNCIEEMMDKATKRRQQIAIEGERLHKKIEKRAAINEVEKDYENALLRLASRIIAEGQEQEQGGRTVRPVSWRA